MKSYTKRIYLTRANYSRPSAVGREACSMTTRLRWGAIRARRWFLEKKIDPTIVDYLSSGAQLLSITGFSLTNGPAPS